MTPRKKIAIVGGGPGAVSAAFWLSCTQALRDAFDITVYAQGWRLGGKCASGRDPKTGRIEEHGLHVLLGCYQHAFHTIRRCFDVWKPIAKGCPADWKDLFTAEYVVSLQETEPMGSSSNQWSPWEFRMPMLPGEPGDMNGGWSPDMANAARELEGGAMTDASVACLASTLLRYLEDIPGLGELNFGPPLSGLCRLAEMPAAADDAESVAADLFELGVRVSTQINAELKVSELALDVASFVLPMSSVLLRSLVLLNIGTALGRGWILDLRGRGQAGFDALDEKDFREWLGGRGASTLALGSAPIRALYDLTFAYPNGNTGSIDNGSIAAGVAFRFVTELAFGYRNAPLWKMNSGMGDTLFVPFYEVLKAQRVSVKLFHRAKQIGMDANGRVDTLEFAVQADVPAGHDPLVDCGGARCWPNAPKPEVNAPFDLEAGDDESEVTTVTLNLGSDFDAVILAVPPETITNIAKDLRQVPGWGSMLSNSASVATCAVQLWLNRDLAALGWDSDARLVTTYAKAFDSWADMSHLLGSEAWPTPERPKSIHYFCGCTSINAPNFDAWVLDHINYLWPNGLDPSSILSRYTRFNSIGWHRYVQTPAGSVKYRFAPDVSGLPNLFLAGDWTKTRYSGGCFESAIESGMLAATAVCRSAPLFS